MGGYTPRRGSLDAYGRRAGGLTYLGRSHGTCIGDIPASVLTGG